MDTISSPVTATKPPLTFDERLTALTGAIEAHHAYLEYYLTGLTRNHADAEDLVSQLWVIVLHRFKDDHIGSLPLLRRKAYQLFIDYYRKKMRSREDTYETMPEQSIQHVGKEAYSSAEEAALKERFWAEFPVDLPAPQKDALWLSARYGFTITEIAEQLNQAPSTVGDWLLRSRQRFAEYLNTL
jgi:RNA polymerase sigma factor (sigma-70 family)